jgi:molecular chaperone HscB
MSGAKVNTSGSVCAHCGAVTEDAHFCPECGKIQPVPPGANYFAFFGLPRKLLIDEAALEKNFYSLSRQLHPDYFMASTGAERRASIDRSSMLNDAYRTLRDRVSRAQYLLQLEGYKEAEKKAPPDLLEEVFELNMQVEELKAAKKMGDEDEVGEARAALEEALQGLKEKLGEIDERLYALFGVWDAAVDGGSGDDGRRAALDRISEVLSHRSYIRNLVRDMREEL